MPDEEGREQAEDSVPSTSLHAHAEGREEDVEGSIGGGQGDQVVEPEKTGGATAGPPGDAADDDVEGSEQSDDPDEDAASD